MRTRFPASRRGLSLLEVQIAGVTGVLIVGTLLSFSRFSSRLWSGAMAGSMTQHSTQAAVQRLAPTVRAARSVVAGSSATRLTLQLPAHDNTGALVIPLQDGEVVSYYLSNETGSPGVTGGTILWRSVNDVPDTMWSMRGGQGRVILAPGGLQFSYYPSAAAAETVTVTVSATATMQLSTDQLSTSQEMLLRNRSL